jgi:hypothetical protein
VQRTCNTVRRRFYSFKVVVLLAGTVLAAHAADCTVQVPTTTPKSEWPHLAEVSRAEAEKAARRRLRVGGQASVLSSELEAEAGCLIWSFDVKIPGEQGISEVHVDAGDGHILSVKHESDQEERVEDRGR